MKLAQVRATLRKAVGEFLVIVLGVGVALAADNWRDERMDRTREREYLARLREELEAGRPLIELHHQRQPAATAALDTLLSMMREGRSRADVGLAKIVEASADYEFNAAGVTFDATYREMLSTGGLNLVSSPAVRTAIGRYYRETSRLEGVIEESTVTGYRAWAMDVRAALGRPPRGIGATMEPTPEESRRLLQLLGEDGREDQLRLLRSRLVTLEVFLGRVLAQTDSLVAVLNERSGTVIAVALTSQEPRAGFPLTLECNARGLPKRSWIRISQIRTLAADRLGRCLARASEEELAEVLEGLNEIIG